MRDEQLDVLRKMVKTHEAQVVRLEKAIKRGAAYPEALRKIINQNQIQHAALLAAIQELTEAQP